MALVVPADENVKIGDRVRVTITHDERAKKRQCVGTVKYINRAKRWFSVEIGGRSGSYLTCFHFKPKKNPKKSTGVIGNRKGYKNVSRAK